jgi:hypothetical protein
LNLQRIIEHFTQNIVISLGSRIRDPGSGKTYFGSPGQEEGTGSRIPDPQQCQVVVSSQREAGLAAAAESLRAVLAAGWHVLPATCPYQPQDQLFQALLWSRPGMILFCISFEVILDRDRKIQVRPSRKKISCENTVPIEGCSKLLKFF